MKCSSTRCLVALLVSALGATICYGIDWSAIGNYIGYTILGQPIKEGALDPLFYSHASEILTQHRQEILSYSEHGVLSVPKVAFINIDDFPETRDALGIESDDEGPFAMLTEDYVFYDLNGKATKIPKGFIFDGASFPKDIKLKFLVIRTEFLVHGVGGVQGSSYDPTVLAAGLIHDYMYRNPDNNPQYTQEYADMMIALNSSISGNKSAMEIWEGLWLAGKSAYSGHTSRRQRGNYEIFTEEYYAQEYERYLQLREGWTNDQIYHRGGATISDDTRKLFAGEGNAEADDDDDEDSSSDVGSSVTPTGGLFDGSLGDLYSTSVGTTVPIAVAGPSIPYRRLFYLFSGDYPSSDDFENTYDSFVTILTGKSPLRDDLEEYKKMYDTIRELGSDLDAYQNLWESVKGEWDALRNR